MKKIILLAALMLGLAVAASAQPRAIGLRGGYGIEASYQHTLSKTNFVQADLGFTAGGFNMTATYNWMLFKPQWTDRGEWGVYAGPGVTLGSNVYSTLSYRPGFHIGVAGIVGLEYTFWFPLPLSVDIRPQFGLGLGPVGFHHSGYWPTIGARYTF